MGTPSDVWNFGVYSIDTAFLALLLTHRTARSKADIKKSLYQEELHRALMLYFSLKTAARQ